MTAYEWTAEDRAGQEWAERDYLARRRAMLAEAERQARREQRRARENERLLEMAEAEGVTA